MESDKFSFVNPSSPEEALCRNLVDETRLEGGILCPEDAKLQPISRANLDAYQVLGREDGLMFALHHDQGFAWSEKELAHNNQHVLPVMRVSLRPSPFRLKQAHHLRVRQFFATRNVPASWLQFYAVFSGGVVSDLASREGGRELWECFIKIAASSAQFQMFVGDWHTGEVRMESSVDNIWSTANALTHKALILKKN